MPSTRHSQEVISEYAAQLANRYARQEIEVIGKYGTEVFVSNAGLDGKKLSVTMRMDYTGMPEVHAQLRKIAERALNESIQTHVQLLIQDEMQEEIEV